MFHSISFSLLLLFPFLFHSILSRRIVMLLSFEFWLSCLLNLRRNLSCPRYDYDCYCAPSYLKLALSALLLFLLLNLTMSTISASINLFFHPKVTFLHFESQHKAQTIHFPRKTKIVCSASEQPPQQRRKQQNQLSNKKAVTDGEIGIDPVGFLTKRGISHKAFAQFLRERCQF